MQIGRYGSIAAAAAGLVTAGVGMILPNDPVVGWTLIGLGVTVFLIGTAWAIVSVLQKRRPSPDKQVEPSIGGIKVNAGDGNKIGDIGHTIRD